ncbi:uncharacterized protein A4U43_C01F17580 [Asparagus officinalis]|uniref:Uncharacterized protein n=1 Tax=Asparagus officinalis TaxID=4686 RepID=A0A5P1FQX5_ASPOF|nr:uncharacterized protein A4U43_C01F17580 [Asparagus officinalis]
MGRPQPQFQRATVKNPARTPDGELERHAGAYPPLILLLAFIRLLPGSSMARAGQKLRLKYNLVEAPYEDWAVHLFCPCCALCQEYRELERRGLDPSLGWMGHLAKQQYAQTTPPTNQSMTK